MSESDLDPEEKPNVPPQVVRPRIVSSRKKTVFVLSQDAEDEEEEEELVEEDDFYDFTEVDTKFRIVNDLEN